MTTAPANHLTAQCCITGGGPAGVMLGFLLARGGVDVLVLEKHADFFRDFRGDTIHPSTLDVLHELGLLDEFLALPHQEARIVGGRVSGVPITLADFTHLPTHCRFIAFVPQWDFLNFIAKQARGYPNFRLKMQTEVTDIIEESGHVAGVKATTPEGPVEIRAGLTIGADGRHSIVSQKAGFISRDLGAPMDVLWMRLSRRPDDPTQTLGYIDAGKIFVMIERDDYWQCAFVIPKGMFEEIRQRGLPSLQEDIIKIVPFMGNRVNELRESNDIKLLTVTVSHLLQWYKPGLLCIGDAAHPMSPIGGIGINLAVQDAVAAANILAKPLREGTLSVDHLKQVQQRRASPAVWTQRVQVFLQNQIISRVLAHKKGKVSIAWPFRLMQRWPWLQRLPARFMGMGFRPEHVQQEKIG